MKSKKNRILIILAVLIIVRMVIVFFETKDKTPEVSVDSSIVDIATVTPDSELPKTPSEAMTTRSESGKEELCNSMKDRYQNLEEVKKLDKTSVRFVNIHKKIDGVVFRTRFFYKDSAENEIPTYLAYKENQNDEEILIEKTPYKKGKEFLRIEKSQGPIIYTEEGVNVGKEQDLFLHYENKQLKDLQGISPSAQEKDFIECRF